MSAPSYPIGTVVSDDDSPTFEIVRVKLKFGCDVKPGTLIRIPVQRGPEPVTLLGRVRSAVEHNPHEEPQAINVRDTLNMGANYPTEEVSTSIYRLIEADLIEQIVDGKLSSPQTLPRSGAEVFEATEDEIVNALGLVDPDDPIGLAIGATVSGTPVEICLRRDSIQRHYFICGTTGSGKSYAMGVVAEELIKQELPIVFLDTQDEYSAFVRAMGGAVVTPGKDFTIRISSLSESELLELLPSATTELQRDIIARAFSELTQERTSEDIAKFGINDILARIKDVGPLLTNNTGSVEMAGSRASVLKREPIFGDGLPKEDWRKKMYPCLAINCKGLVSSRVQSIATAVLRELQTLRLHNHVPPYVAVIDEAHLFVPEGEGSACKQIIREGVRIGRHHGIAMVLMTQSPVDIDKRTIRQCNTRLVFALEPDQLDAIRGVRADASEELLRSLPKLPRGTCLLSGTYESVRHAIPIKIRQRETENSEGGQTPDIFQEMSDYWKPRIDDYRQRYGPRIGQ
jgi:hypothetical protein